MGTLKYAVSSHMEGFEVEKTDYSKYETSFRRWLVSQIDSGQMSVQEAKERFKFPRDFETILSRWRKRYGSPIYVSLPIMTAEEQAEMEKLRLQNAELRAQCEAAQIKNVLLETMIDLASEELKVDIRKKSGPKQ